MTRTLAEEVAAALGLEVVRPLAGGIFGAVLVQGPAGVPLVLKAQPDPELAPVWATGAAVSGTLRASGYPAPRYEATGSLPVAVWSLQEELAGSVPERLTASAAGELVALICAHDTDSGLRRPWRDDALAAARGWLARLASFDLPGAPCEVIEAALVRTADAELAETTVVHGDFHHRNCMVDEDAHVVGVFDWEIAGPGDWRFDLATLTLGCLLYPASCEPDAARVAMDAFAERCARDAAVLMMMCQGLRLLAMQAARRPDRLASSATRILDCLQPWLPPRAP